ncbi:hypothetical protein G6F31_021168 [Rhizopus arrhizus]|nr:hypothetical protein G6F31_021168 [Rhizopus arrhizus]
MPMLTDGFRVMPPTENGWASATRMCSAAAVSRPCSKSGIIITNSSPDSRPTMSVARARRRKRWATSRSKASPMGWPRVSLTCLKRSRSRNSTATRLRSGSARARACSAWASSRLRFGRPVSSS